MSLMTDYRPTNFDEIVGHESIKKILKNKLSNSNHPHCYLFSGESGLGKTTFARVIANVVNATSIEFDAGNLTGVDEIRNLIKESSIVNITGKTKKCFIIDECHMLSKSSWNSLLKTIEEPSKFTYFIFCTTELNKVPAAIKNQRCITLKLNPLSYDNIYELLKNVKIDIDNKYIELIAKNCGGSPRKALNMLETAMEVSDIKEFSKIVKDGIDENLPEPVLNICKELCKSNIKEKLLIDNLKEIKNYEGARIQIFNYLTSVCMNNTNLLERLICFSDSIVSNTTGKGELLIKLLMARVS